MIKLIKINLITTKVKIIRLDEVEKGTTDYKRYEGLIEKKIRYKYYIRYIIYRYIIIIIIYIYIYIYLKYS